MEPNKHSIGSIIAGILFLIVFIGGMIGIYVGTTDDIRISIISLGAILLAVGIAAMSSAVKQKGSKKVLPVTISLVFVLIGAGLITLPLLNMLTGFEIGGEIIIYASLGLFVVIGLLLIVIPIAKRAYMKRVCTCVIEAKCVGLEKSPFRDNYGRCRSYYPVWEYTFDGVSYHEQESMARNFGLPSEGDYCELHVNPDVPTEFYQETSPVNLFFLILGACFAALGILAIVLTTSQME